MSVQAYTSQVTNPYVVYDEKLKVFEENLETAKKKLSEDLELNKKELDKIYRLGTMSCKNCLYVDRNAFDVQVYKKKYEELIYIQIRKLYETNNEKIQSKTHYKNMENKYHEYLQKRDTAFGNCICANIYAHQVNDDVWYKGTISFDYNRIDHLTYEAEKASYAFADAKYEIRDVEDQYMKAQQHYVYVMDKYELVRKDTESMFKKLQKWIVLVKEWEKLMIIALIRVEQFHGPQKKFTYESLMAAYIKAQQEHKAQ